MSQVNVVLLIYLHFVAIKCSASVCVTSLQRDHKNILLIQNGQVRIPDDAMGNIILNVNEILTFACPGDQVTITKTQFVDAKCVSNDQFTIGNTMYSASQITCAEKPQSTISRTGTCLNGQYDQFKIGFNTGKGFISHIELCFNNINKATLYEYSVVSSKIGAAQRGSRPEFIPNAPYITRALAAKYRRVAQYATLEKTLNTPGGGLPPYMQNVELMGKGHLAANADFIYKAQKEATFYYMNAAPQWCSANAGNWNDLEISIRDLAKATNKDYDVYTGTYGTLDLEKSESGRAKIYLDGDNDRLPVPQYYWKVVIEKGGDTGIAFIGMNNVFEQQDNPCPNIIGQVTWLKSAHWNNVTLGYTLACDVNIFKNIPGLKLQLPPLPNINHILFSPDNMTLHRNKFCDQ
ncbi:uncharacterized protein CBL_00388 [Carabus blaptoides fortunei]